MTKELCIVFASASVAVAVDVYSSSQCSSLEVDEVCRSARALCAHDASASQPLSSLTLLHPLELPLSFTYLCLISPKSGLLVLNRHITPCRRLVLVPNEIADLLVLGLFNSTLVVLSALVEEILLDVVDACLGIH